MYLFTRSGRFGPGANRDVVSFVGEVTEKARQETGLAINAWSATMSPELGTVVWAAFVDDLAHLEQANDKLAASESFLDLSDRGAGLFAGPLSDMVAQVVAGDVDASAPTPMYVTSARAVAANGHLRAAIEGGVEIAEAVGRITGIPSLFLVGSTGPYGGCAWTSGYPDIGEVERAESALMADASWIDLIDRVGGVRARPRASRSTGAPASTPGGSPDRPATIRRAARSGQSAVAPDVRRGCNGAGRIVRCRAVRPTPEGSGEQLGGDGAEQLDAVGVVAVGRQVAT